MHRSILPAALAAAVFLFPVRVEAQVAPQHGTTLARLTREAVAANPSLIASGAMAHAAASRFRPAGALPDPTLSVGVVDLVLPSFAFNQSDFTEVDFELSQEVPWPGTLGARTAAARATATARAADVAARRRDIVVRTAELYSRLRYVVTARATLARQRVLLATGVEISNARYASTSVPQSDPLQARVAWLVSTPRKPTLPRRKRSCGPGSRPCATSAASIPCRSSRFGPRSCRPILGPRPPTRCLDRIRSKWIPCRSIPASWRVKPRSRLRNTR